MRRQLSRKINRLEEKLSAVARRPEVMFLMPGEDVDEAKQQRYGDNIPDDARLLIVTFRSA
ncbi:MAG: hypothetical protein OSB82_17790 [Alphaproteobacteria bacterium]|nr:hypothetical protein [Alphaproteobacteria bacterium]